MTILDTNVLSEVMKPKPSQQVLRWLAGQATLQLFTTTITQAEILCGIGMLPEGKRKASLQAAVEAMFAEDFAGRILPFDSDAARLFANIAAARRLRGRPISQFDAQIAAIARSRGASIATRKAHDFEGCNVVVLNPWGGD